jgi:hypothetical protein
MSLRSQWLLSSVLVLPALTSKRGETWCEILYENGNQVEIFPCMTRFIPAGNSQALDCCPHGLWNSVTADGNRAAVTQSAAWLHLTNKFPHMTQPENITWNGQKKWAVDSSVMCQKLMPSLMPLMQKPAEAICNAGGTCINFRWLINNTVVEKKGGAFGLLMDAEPHPLMTFEKNKPTVIAEAPDGKMVMLLKTYFTQVPGTSGEATTVGGTTAHGTDPDLCSYATSAAVANAHGWKVRCGLLKETVTCGGDGSCRTNVTGDNWQGGWCQADSLPDVCSMSYDRKQGCDQATSTTISTTVANASSSLARSANVAFIILCVAAGVLNRS